MTDTDFEILSKQTPATLAKWCCLLNGWEWPDELPDEESEVEYRSFMLKYGGPGARHSRRGEIMRWIESQVNPRLISRTWNKDMTDEEFDDFWRGNYEGDADALARDRLRRKAKAAARLGVLENRAEEWPDIIGV